MREIKFRCWSGVKFHYWGVVDGKFISPIYSDDKLVLEITQYTGLHDKNGKEIYEGDIVKIEIHEKDEERKIKTLPIVYQEHCSQFRAYNKGWTSYIFYSDWTEVIGNIYENKNLLE